MARRHVLPALALLVWGAGCEALVNGQLGDVHCTAEGVLGPPACPEGSGCSGGLCVPTGLGILCGADADCAPTDFCLDPAVLGAAGPRRCSRSCCSSSDCDPDALFVCAVAATGGGFCRPASDLGRAAVGTRQAMAPCAGDADCRSGRCLDHLCLDTCCSDTPCALGAATNGHAGDAGDAGDAGPAGAPAGVCRVEQPAGEAFGFWCSAPSGSVPRYGECANDADCSSGLCVTFGTIGSFCAPPCCSSRDCEEIGPGAPVRCVTTPGPDPVRACAGLAPPMASGDVGVPCATGADCRSGDCLATGGRQVCSDACCSDVSCGEGAVPSLGCRPTQLEGGWALQCVLK